MLLTIMVSVGFGFYITYINKLYGGEYGVSNAEQCTAAARSYGTCTVPYVMSVPHHLIHALPFLQRNVRIFTLNKPISGQALRVPAG